MKIRHWGLVFISGMLWLVMGITLIMRGLRLTVEAVAAPQSSPLMQMLSDYFTSARSTASFLIALAIVLGTLKGRFVLRKAVKRVVNRILSLDHPLKVHQMYSPKFYLLVAFMISLSFFMRVFSVPSDVRGVLDLAVGSALMNGAFLYFRSSSFIKAHS